MGVISRLAPFLLTGIAFIPSYAGRVPSRFETGKNTFLLDGMPFQIKAAELHYPRIPRPYWRQRIEMCKALGMNTICLYVFWNAHEPRPGQYDFSGDLDLAHFIDLCQEAGMKVILRPGPYVCAEWEMGGLPWWLLKEKDIELRHDDPRFVEAVKRFEAEVARQVRDRTIDRGGPVIMVQVENEYGSYGQDKTYIAKVRDLLREHYPEVLLFQCDWSSNFMLNGLPDLLWTMNFGAGTDIDSQFKPLLEVRPDTPLMCSEYWSGWFDKWGAPHETRDSQALTQGIEEFLEKGISFSLYMTHGGTNWGHWAGANSPGFSPDVTSYDYDAPISENGTATPKYHLLRELMQRHSPTPLPEIPAEYPTMSVDTFRIGAVAPLWSFLTEAESGTELMPMEQHDQGFGSLVYRTSLPQLPDSTLLTVTEPHDYAQIFIDSKPIGTLDRRLGQNQIMLPPTEGGAVLDIMVESMGRINFGTAIKDPKGITEKVTLSLPAIEGTAEYELMEWQTFLLPDSLEFYHLQSFYPTGAFGRDAAGRYPAGVYQGILHTDTCADTFLDFSQWGKGLAYINGHPLGRFWEIGPQQTLYTPGCWLREGDNLVEIFDVTGPRDPILAGYTVPIYDRISTPGTILRDPAPPIEFGKFKEWDVVHEGGWQTFPLDSAAHTRYIKIEPTGPSRSPASLSEIYLLDESGKRIDREKWKVVSCDSETKEGNHTADKLFDLQESTYWQAAPDISDTSSIVIDMGSDTSVSALQLLPRQDKAASGCPKKIKLWVQP